VHVQPVQHGQSGNGTLLTVPPGLHMLASASKVGGRNGHRAWRAGQVGLLKPPCAAARAVRQRDLPQHPLSILPTSDQLRHWSQRT